MKTREVISGLVKAIPRAATTAVVVVLPWVYSPSASADYKPVGVGEESVFHGAANRQCQKLGIADYDVIAHATPEWKLKEEADRKNRPAKTDVYLVQASNRARDWIIRFAEEKGYDAIVRPQSIKSFEVLPEDYEIIPPTNPGDKIIYRKDGKDISLDQITAGLNITQEIIEYGQSLASK